MRILSRTTWYAGLLISAATFSGYAVVLGPRLATASDANPGALLVAELNCAACHKPAETDHGPVSRQSPVLGRAGLRITPQYLRRFLADPLGYKRGTTMPDLLAGASAEEKQESVEALVHYLVSEQSTSAQPGTAAEDYLVRQGRTLYHTIGCVACHEPEIAPAPAPGGTAPAGEVDSALQVPASVPLGDLARKMTVDQLAAFLLDPLKTRPSGRMPSLNLTSGEATAIAVYLLRDQASHGGAQPSPLAGLRYQYFEESFGGSPDFSAMTPKSSGNIDGFDLKPRQRDQQFGFRFTGSINIPRDGRYIFFTRSDDGSMLYIDGKLVVNNGGDHAPDEKRGSIDLTAGEHSIEVTFYNNGAGFELQVSWRGPGFNKEPIPSSILSHIGQPMEPIDNEPFVVDRAKADKGRQLFASLGCAACHKVDDQPLGNSAAKPLNELRGSGRGCLAETPEKGVPHFGFTPDQRAAIAHALEDRDWAPPKALDAQLTRRLAQLNCYACHTRDGKGGATDARLAYFRVGGDLDMGDEGRIPPHLTGVGGKLRPEWTREVLLNHGAVRPYMNTRMPQFGAENVGALPALFERADARSNPQVAPEMTQRDAKFGRKLAGAGGLSCIACHPVGSHKSLGIPAINLAVMSKRLKYDWFTRYLIDPPALRPGTRMPSFWPNGEAANKDILDGNTQAQINALWAYLESKPETDLPDGLVQGRQELIATTEPIIYRNFILGAGPRAIGVGYPEKVNLAFDANNMRLAMIWQGAFIDAARHWNGRGEGFEPPLGNNVLKLPEGPEFAVLNNSESAWPSTAGKEAGYHMGGYSLDEQRRPAFFYRLNDLKIEDSVEPVRGEIDAYFKRTLSLEGPPVSHLWFRAAMGDIKKKGDTFVENDRIVFKFPNADAVLRGEGNNKELLVPVTFHGNEAKIIEEIIW